MSVFDVSSIKHVELSNVSPKAYMLVSDHACRSPIKHVGLWCVSNQVRWSPLKNVDCWSQMGLRWSMSRSPMGLQSGMSVSDRSPLGLRLVSDNNNIFVNSVHTVKYIYFQDIAFKQLYLALSFWYLKEKVNKFIYNIVNTCFYFPTL